MAMHDFMAQADAARKAYEKQMEALLAASFEQIKTTLEGTAQFMSDAQRAALQAILHPAGKAVPAATKSKGVVPPKFQIPSGETWAGRGQPPKTFTIWSGSAEGKAWHKANGKGYPAYPFTGKAGGKPAAKKSAKKAPRKARSK